MDENEDTSPYQKLLDVAAMIDQWADDSEAGGLTISPRNLRRVATDIRQWVDEHRGNMETGYVHRARLQEALR